MIEVTGLYIYPVKSLKAIPLDSANITPTGLQYDRNWIIIDRHRHAITQREIPMLATVTVAITDSQLILSHSSCDDLKINLKHTTPLNSIELTLWKDTCTGLDEGQIASTWLHNAIGPWENGPLRLIRYSAQHQRPVETDHLDGIYAHTAFPDAYPLLITSESTLEFLNQTLRDNNENMVSMDRFRPNIVIKGLQRFKEHELKHLTSMDKRFTLKMCKPCQRCKITTIDQTNGAIKNPKEPLKTLLQINPLNNLSGAFFGENAVLLSSHSHTINIGEQLITS